MSNIQPENPEPESASASAASCYEQWLAKDAERRAQIKDAIGGIKTELFDLLEAVGISHVTVDFDGCGDSGQIDNIVAFDEHGIVPLPLAFMSRASVDPDVMPSKSEGEPIADAIELLAYDLLESEHDGWEINEGAFGEFRFDVADRTITLGCHIRVSSSEFTETNW
jgi:hypothetical protein